MSTHPQITTNVDAWHATHAGLRDGHSIGKIAAHYDLSYQMVGNYSRMPSPPNPRPLGRTAGPRRRKANRPCTDCGAALNHNKRHAGTRCQACDIAARKAPITKQCAQLHEWANDHGIVPPVRQAATILGVARATAGERCLIAFGPDPLEPGQRTAAGPREWPPRIPSDPIG